MKKVLVVDPAKCKGCHSCEIACATWNEGGGSMTESRIKVASFLKELFFYPSVCLQCEIPSCAQVCPVAALKKNAETGVVELDKSKCIGCKVCLIACPFGNMTFTEEGVCAKCEHCGGDPACVKVCQWNALIYGEAGEIGSGRRIALATRFLEAEKEAR